MIKSLLSASFIVLLLQVIESEAHGRLLVPPARSSAWREDPARFPSYFDDAQMFCGGFQTQWGANGGLCGICGEEYKSVKKFEKGGSLYRGLTVRTYTQGEVIEVVVEITANHKGFFEFRLCDVAKANNDGEATQQCLNQNLLKDTFGRMKIPCLPGTGKFTSKLLLPATMSCTRCVFQWKYTTGNSWGTDPSTKKSCMGCGPQETFMGCSDVEIKKAPRTTNQEWLSSSNDLSIEDDEETAAISKSLLKRLYNELKRLKSQETMLNNERNLLGEENQLFAAEREMVGEPMHQKMSNDLISRGFREKSVLNEQEEEKRISDDLISRGFREKSSTHFLANDQRDLNEELVAKGFREKSLSLLRQERRDLNSRLKRLM